MVTALEVIGFNEEDAGEAFAQYTGILTLSDLIDMKILRIHVTILIRMTIMNLQST